jgi:hypothetical protein
VDYWSSEIDDRLYEFAADLEMTEGHPHPPVLTTRVRPNLFVDGKYYVCAVTKTIPPEGIPARTKGSVTAATICPAEDVERFVPGGAFDLRDGPRHTFAKGVFREIGPREEYNPTPAE